MHADVLDGSEGGLAGPRAHVGAAADASRGQAWIHMMTNSLGGPGRTAHRFTGAGCHAGAMRVVEIDQAAREVREHCAPFALPRVVTSGNFASPVILLASLLGDLPAARLHALNAQPSPASPPPADSPPRRREGGAGR